MLAPHTSLCLGVESFTEENRSPLHVGTYISVDVTVCKVTLVILHGVVSPDTLRRALSPQAEVRSYMQEEGAFYQFRSSTPLQRLLAF